MPADHAQTSHARPKPIGEYLEVPIAGVVAEVIVDRLQSVEVEIQDRDGSGASRRESVGKVRNKRSTIVQTGQIVMLGQVAKPFFGGDADLEPCKHGRDRPERVICFGFHFVPREFDEAEYARSSAPSKPAVRRRPRATRRGGVPRSDPVRPVDIVRRVQLDHDRFLAVAHSRRRQGRRWRNGQRSKGSGSGRLGRGGHSATNFEARMLWSL